jgi:2-oxoglutarate dehydrogenase E1 component
MSLDFKDFQGVNEGYVLELYDRFVGDPQSVDEKTRALFRTWTPPGASPVTGSPRPRAPLSDGLDIRIAVGAISLAESIRRYGHLAARIDPLGGRPRGNPLLHPEGHSITSDQLRLVPASLINEAVAVGCDTMFDLVEKLRSIYCGTTGYDIAHIFVPEERLWLRDAIETGMYRAPKDPIDPVALLDRLTDVEVFEKFLHRTYPG